MFPLPNQFNSLLLGAQDQIKEQAPGQVCADLLHLGGKETVNPGKHCRTEDKSHAPSPSLRCTLLLLELLHGGLKEGCRAHLQRNLNCHPSITQLDQRSNLMQRRCKRLFTCFRDDAVQGLFLTFSSRMSFADEKKFQAQAVNILELNKHIIIRAK
ncbi:hypothetical protein AVEN_69568-1 [Araneus ventricosus]|uniref:Uncharacterized protein n=1 Tax=Araneus ventricosus TaxID=182803 RepID=A0A4Y2H9F9_ARAVE|nr:hypothetical protein AVEN_69568-1 [Araneus ventricosus]